MTDFIKFQEILFVHFMYQSVDKELAPQFMKNLLDSHHEILFLTQDNKI